MSIMNIADFVSEIMTKENKVIQYSGYDINIEHHKGNVFISFINSAGILIVLEKNVSGLIIIRMVNCI